MAYILLAQENYGAYICPVKNILARYRGKIKIRVVYMPRKINYG